LAHSLKYPEEGNLFFLT